MSAALHLRGVLLPGGETGDLWLQDGLISHQPIPGATTVFDGGYVLFEADEDARQRVLAEAVSRGSVTGFSRRRPTLSEIFQEVVQ